MEILQAHQIELLSASASAVNGEHKSYLENSFKRLSSNKLGEILKASGPGTLNCMKLAHYLPVYEELFNKLPKKRVRVLEIGVQHGGSYRLWSNFFGQDLLEWTGIDIQPKCLKFNNLYDSRRAHVFCGSQDDPEFLSKVIAQRGPFDVVIDDGSHMVDHIIKSFEVLSSAVVSNGFYIIEDVHACYWQGFRGSGEDLNVLSYFQRLLHSLNSQCLAHPRRAENIQPEEMAQSPAPLKRIEFLPSMIVCHMGTPDPLIEWKAGLASIQRSE